MHKEVENGETALAEDLTPMRRRVSSMPGVATQLRGSKGADPICRSNWGYGEKWQGMEILAPYLKPGIHFFLIYICYLGGWNETPSLGYARQALHH